jgi:hypothetical protein
MISLLGKLLSAHLAGDRLPPPGVINRLDSLDAEQALAERDPTVGTTGLRNCFGGTY